MVAPRHDAMPHPSPQFVIYTRIARSAPFLSSRGITFDSPGRNLEDSGPPGPGKGVRPRVESAARASHLQAPRLTI